MTPCQKNKYMKRAMLKSPTHRKMIKSNLRKIYLILTLLFVVLLGCTGNLSSDTNSILVEKENIELKNNIATCYIDSILSNRDFLFLNQDTVRLLQKNQLIYSLDLQVRKTLKNHNYGNYYYVSTYNSNHNFLMFTYFEDETEAPTVYLATIKNCELISKITLGYHTSWEHGNKTIQSIIHKDKTIEKISYSASRDFGDYKEWKYDTLIEKYKINNNGFIEELK